jgi:hypothetical protein
MEIKCTVKQRKEVARLFLALLPRMQAAGLGCLRELTTRGSSSG